MDDPSCGTAETDMKNRVLATVGEGEKVGSLERALLKHIHYRM